MNGNQIPATIDLSMNVFLAEASIDRDGNVRGDVAITSMEVHIGGKVCGQFQGNAPVAGVQGPTRSHSRTGLRPSLDAAVSGGEFEDVESSGGSNAAICCAGP